MIALDEGTDMAEITNMAAILASAQSVLKQAAGRRVGAQDCPASRIVAVIGAGFSGTMAAIHLRHRLPADTVIYLFDRTGRFARGPAYAASASPHLLNVRASNMSAFPEDPGHFERWMAQLPAGEAADVEVTEAGSFASRRLYGRYLRALLYEEMSQSGGRVRLSADSVIGLGKREGGWQLRCASGREVMATAVVLAVGNLPSTRPSDGVVFYDPWTSGAITGLKPAKPVLIVGTGLTMVDLALDMSKQGFAGPIIALSRRGLAPQRHEEPGPAWPLPELTAQERISLRALMHRVRAEVRQAEAAGIGWRSVIDSLRPITAALWQGLPKAERSRFLRHVRPYWDIHRHRMAPTAARQFSALVQQGALSLQRGIVVGVELTGAEGAVATLQNRATGQQRKQEVQRVIYATGVGAGTASDGLVASLIDAGIARTDQHGLGLDVTSNLGVIGRDGAARANVWALGPIVRGVFWECVAVPDIRVQAARIATEVVGQLSSVR